MFTWTTATKILKYRVDAHWHSFIISNKEVNLFVPPSPKRVKAYKHIRRPKQMEVSHTES